MDSNDLFFTAKELSMLLGIKERTALKIIHQANQKLNKAGKIVIRGKVLKSYIWKMLDTSDAS